MHAGSECLQISAFPVQRLNFSMYRRSFCTQKQDIYQHHVLILTPLHADAIPERYEDTSAFKHSSLFVHTVKLYVVFPDNMFIFYLTRFSFEVAERLTDFNKRIKSSPFKVERFTE